MLHPSLSLNFFVNVSKSSNYAYSYLEADLSGNVNVEEMDFAELPEEGAFGGPHRRRVEELLALALRDRAPNQIDL